MIDSPNSIKKPLVRVQVMVAIWGVLFVVSIVAAAMTEKTGDSFVRGMNRVFIFFWWQCAAFVFAVISFVAARRNALSLPKSWRIGGMIPICIHALMVLFIVGVIVFTIATKPAAP